MSQSATVHHRFHRNSITRKSIAIFYVLMMAVYLSWRTTVFSPTDFFFSLLFYAAEALGFLLSLGYIVSTWNIKHRPSKPVLEDQKVDVFIPAYQESADVIRMTLIGAKNIRYPHETYLLDDGDRDDLRALAAELDVHYICRPVHNHAKAGNINYALEQTEGEFFLVFDADHIAQPQVIEHMIGFFVDEQIGMVQAPQDFYNTDSIEHQPVRKGREIWHEQIPFYSTMLAGRDSHGALQGIGSGAFYRRSAIEAIGGIPTSSVTEDIYTSLKLHQHGYKTAFYNEPIAYGLASTDLNDFYKTRHRWTHGNFQVLSLENFCIGKSLTWRQKIVYLFTIVAYVEGWQQLMLALVPILTIAFGLRPFDITVTNIAIILTVPLVSLFLLSRISGGFNRIFQNEILALMRMPPHLISLPGLLRKKIRWNVSLKNIKGHFSYRLLWPQISLLIISLTTIMLGYIKMAENHFHKGPLLETIATLLEKGVTEISTEQFTISSESLLHTSLVGFSIDLFIVAGGWSAYNVVRTLALILRVKRCAERSNTFFRFPLQLSLLDNKKRHIADTEWISESHLKATQKLSNNIFITLPSGLLELQLTPSENNCYQIDWASNSDHDTLAMSLYSVDWHRELYHRNIPHLGFFTRVTRWLKHSPTAPSWTSGVDENGALALVELTQKEVVLFDKKARSGDRVQVTVGNKQHQLILTSELTLPSVCSVNIDGVERQRFCYQDA